MEVQKVEKKKGKATDIEIQFIINQILVLRSKIGSWYEFADQPVPYSYVHAVNMIQFCFLNIFSVALGYSYDSREADVLYFIVVFIVEFLLLGMYAILTLTIRRLCVLFQDPYGNDIEDLSVIHYIRFAIIDSSKMLLCR